MSSGLSVWFILIAALAVTIIVIGFVTRSRDRKRWSLWARARHWEFFDKWQEIIHAFSGGPFGRGSSRRASLGFRGNFDGLPAGGFRYQYTTGSGDDTTTHYFQILFVRIRSAKFPRLALSHENWGTRTFVKDIEFEDAEFNRIWHVRGQNPRFVHDVIHPRMMEFLKDGGVPDLSTLWLHADQVVLAVKGHLKPEQIDAHLRFLTQFASRIPGFVLDGVGAQRLQLSWDGPGVSAEEQATRMAELERDDA